MKNQEYITPVDQFVIDFVKELRDKKKLTQQDLANILGVSRSYIRDIESTNSAAKFNIRNINTLADHFGLSPRAFLPEKALPSNFPGREGREEAKEKKAVRGKEKQVKKKTATKKARKK